MRLVLKIWTLSHCRSSALFCDQTNPNVHTAAARHRGYLCRKVKPSHGVRISVL